MPHSTSLKNEAVEFPRVFKKEEAERRRALKPIALENFRGEYLRYSAGVHTAKTREPGGEVREPLSVTYKER